MRALLPRENGASCASGDAPLNAAPSPPRVGQPGGIVPSPPASQDELKKAAAWKAAELVEDGMVLGLGTGSTVAFAVERVAQLLREGALRDVVGIATSAGTLEQAKALGIPLATLAEYPRLDLAIDGADEVDPNLDLVKGRGGALLREKMVERVSSKFVCIVDESKLVNGLGGSRGAMPVEIIKFAWQFTLDRLKNLPETVGCDAKLRTSPPLGEPYITENGNYIVDLYFREPMVDPHATAESILKLEGVVDHGLFLDMVDVCIVGRSGGVEILERK